MPIAGEYPATALETWPRSSYLPKLVRVEDRHGQQVFAIPLEFILKGQADTSRVSYLVRIVEAVTEPAQIHISLLFNDDQVMESAEIVEGVYVVLFDAAQIPWRHGPQGKSRSNLFQDTNDNDTISNSSRDSGTQDKFRMALIGRDGHCLISEEDDTEELIGCHIVPNSLGQTYVDNIVGLQNLVRLSGPSNGLTLTASFHNKFDKFKWSIYEHCGSYFIHSFHGDMAHYHGKEVEFRSKKRHRLPDTKLLAWHYDQCAMTRFRGFGWKT